MENKNTNLPVTLLKDQNTILLSWENLFMEHENIKSRWSHINIEFMLFVKREEKWIFVYRGTQTKYYVKNLAPSTCYTFKLVILNGEDKIDIIIFKATTEFEPYYHIHISRAISQGKTSLMRKVVAQRSSLLELETTNKKTPLNWVAELGDLPMATLLISLGANVNNVLTYNKRTPLMSTLFHGNLQVANLLMDKGANVKLKDCNGLTGLHYAVDSGVLENVEFAVEHGCDVNEIDRSGWTPLLRAVVMECDDVIIIYLINKGADIHIKDRNGFNFYKHCEIAGRIITIKTEDPSRDPTSN